MSNILPWNHRPPVIKVYTPPVYEPLSLAEAKAQLRVEQDFSDDDDYIQLAVGAAREFCEKRKGYCWAEQTLEYWLEEFPSSGTSIELPRSTPLQSINSVTYFDADGNETEWEASNYRAATARTPGLLVPNYGVAYPTYVPQPEDSVRIRYVAGPPVHSPAVPIPSYCKLAMGQLVNHWYDNRGTQASDFSVPKPLMFSVDDFLSLDQQIF